MDQFKKIKNFTYNERHCLGEGSFGKVYEGTSQQGLRVAIKKVQQRTISKDQYLRASLQTQISIMKKLNHPNIVKLYDIVMTVNHIYLIMQFCGGGDLKRYCRNRKIPEEQACQIIKQISKGFQQIVRNGIIHRDLKPANILVHEGSFKICDFGFAKFFSDTSRMAKTCVGTPIYMSPQVLHQKPYTNKTDIWSLGVLFYELLFAKLPYYGSSQDELYRAIVKGNLQIPSCSKSTAMLLKKMLEVDENKRYHWNQIFEHFQLGQLQQDYQKQIFPPPPQQQKVEIQNNFYRQRQPSSYEQLPPPKNNYIQAQLDNNIGILNDSPLKRPQKNYLIDDQKEVNNGLRNDEKKNIPQRKPKNPLAYQTMNQNYMSNSVNNRDPPQLKNRQSQTQQNPRFYYFVLVQLIINPLQNCQSYSKFISSLYHETLTIYEQAIQKASNKNKVNSSIYKKVLINQFQQIKSLQSQIPNFKGTSLKEDASQLIIQINQRNRTKENLKNMKWIQKLLIKDFTYTSVNH